MITVVCLSRRSIYRSANFSIITEDVFSAKEMLELFFYCVPIYGSDYHSIQQHMYIMPIVIWLKVLVAPYQAALTPQLRQKVKIRGRVSKKKYVPAPGNAT